MSLAFEFPIVLHITHNVNSDLLKLLSGFGMILVSQIQKCFTIVNLFGLQVSYFLPFVVPIDGIQFLGICTVLGNLMATLVLGEFPKGSEMCLLDHTFKFLLPSCNGLQLLEGISCDLSSFPFKHDIVGRPIAIFFTRFEQSLVRDNAFVLPHHWILSISIEVIQDLVVNEQLLSAIMILSVIMIHFAEEFKSFWVFAKFTVMLVSYFNDTGTESLSIRFMIHEESSTN